jgi:hypothetical protein
MTTLNRTARRPRTRPRTVAELETEREHAAQTARLFSYAYRAVALEFKEPHDEVGRGCFRDERGSLIRPRRDVVAHVLEQLLLLATEASGRAREIDRLEVR